MAIEFTVNTKSESPPGNWKITVPETGYTVKHYAYDAFLKAYEAHMLANNIPLEPDYEDQLLDRMCRENQPEWQNFCKRTGGILKRKATGFASAMGFLNVLRKWVVDMAKGKDAFVSPEIAEERAKICSSCPLNSKQAAFGCGTCQSTFLKLIHLLVGNRKTPYSTSCGFCGACGCAINAAVWFPIEAQKEGLTEGMKDSFQQVKTFCWKAKGLDL